MKTILLPVDFSSYAEAALKFAVLLFKNTDSKFILLHTFHTVHSNAYASAKAVNKGKKRANGLSKSKLMAFYKKVCPESNIPVEYVISSEPLRDLILHTITNKNVDLIVMGTQGSGSKISGHIFGTNASWVIEHVKCPVITVPSMIIPSDVKHIVYATNYLDSDIAHLKQLKEISNTFQPKITLFHVAENLDSKAQASQQLFEEKVKEHFPGNEITFDLQENDRIVKCIESYIKSTGADLLVMSAHIRDTFDKLFGKSFTRVMTFDLKAPLLAFHHQK